MSRKNFWRYLILCQGIGLILLAISTLPKNAMAQTITPTRQVTVAVSDAPFNEVLRQISPVTVFERTFRLRVRLFGLRITLARFTINISIRSPRLTFLESNESARAELAARIRVRVSRFISFTPRARADVTISTNPDLTELRIIPGRVRVSYTVRLFGIRLFRLRFSFSLGFLRFTFNLPRLETTFTIPSPVNRSLTFRPINAILRSTRREVIVEADISVMPAMAVTR